MSLQKPAITNHGSRVASSAGINVAWATAAAAFILAKSLNLNTFALFAASISAPPEVLLGAPGNDSSGKGSSTTVCALMGK